MITKFNTLWQLTRVKAKKLKGVDNKLSHVMNFLNNYPNKHNRSRVLNWLEMSILGYKDGYSRKLCHDKIFYIHYVAAWKYTDTIDSDISLAEVSDEDLKLLCRDLSSRKYGFQFKVIPKEHEEYVARLKEEIDRRGL